MNNIDHLSLSLHAHFIKILWNCKIGKLYHAFGKLLYLQRPLNPPSLNIQHYLIHNFPVVCPESWSQFEDHCYFLVTDKYDMTACRDVCRQQNGADLASIHSSGENEFLTEMIEHRPVRGGRKVGIQWDQAGKYTCQYVISRQPGLAAR